MQGISSKATAAYSNNMIATKKELRFYIMADTMMNRGYFKPSIKERLREILAPDYIMEYLVSMRKYSFYGGVSRTRFLALFNKWRFRRLGLKLGFTIGENVFGYGLVIPHYGTIVVDHTNRIGNYAVLHTSTCITDNGKVIGDSFYLSTGVKMTKKVSIGNGVSVGANSLVNKDVPYNNVLIAGMPANVIKDSPVWWEKGDRYLERVRKVEALKKELLG